MQRNGTGWRAAAALCLATLALGVAGCRSGHGVADGDAHAARGTLERALLRSETLRAVGAAADEHRLKIELAEVVDVVGGRPVLRRESFDAGPAYWYPASTVKSCAVVAALQELARLARETGRPIDRDTPLVFHPLFDGEAPYDHDPTHAADGTVTVAHLARKILLVSDNDAFNRLYDLCGRDALNGRMAALGLDGIRVRHRLSVARTAAENARAPRVDLLVRDGGPPVTVPERAATRELGAFVAPADRAPGTAVGVAHLSGGARVEEPLDFSRKNEAALRDLLDLHVLLLRPDVALGGGRTARLELSDDDRAFVFEAMRQRPRDSADPLYDADHYVDEYSKFLAPGIWRAVGAERAQVLDKVGRAYGFSATNSYVLDTQTGRAFFLAATLYTNPDGVLNDDAYDYALADRFFADLGEAVARELWDLD